MDNGEPKVKDPPPLSLSLSLSLSFSLKSVSMKVKLAKYGVIKRDKIKMRGERENLWYIYMHPTRFHCHSDNFMPASACDS